MNGPGKANDLRVTNDTTTVSSFEDMSPPPAYSTLEHTPPAIPEKSAVILRYPGSEGVRSAAGARPPISGTSAVYGDGGARRSKSVA